MPVIILTNGDGSFDISNLTDSVTWSGEYRSCARSLDFGLISTPEDNRLPEVDCSVGSSVVAEENGECIFNGFIADRTKSTNSTTIDVSCLDRGLYLNRNRTSKKLTATPEGAAQSLCREFGITAGNLAKTGVTIKRKFFASSLYEIIANMYTEAAKSTGTVYHIGFEGDKLTVREKGTGQRVLLIKGGSNLMSATVSESMRNIINQVSVQDKDGNHLYFANDKKSMKAYGTMQEVIRQTDIDPVGEAKRLLSAAEAEQKITVENLGDIRCVTGGAVMMEESYTGLYGLFFIDADTHTWKNGLYFNKLTLNLKSVMDEKTAGEVLESDKPQGTAKKLAKTDEYINEYEIER